MKTFANIAMILMLIGSVIGGVFYVERIGEERFCPKSIEAEVKRLPQLYAQKSTETEVKELRYERDIRDLEQRKFNAEKVYQGQPMPHDSQRAYDKLERELEEIKEKKKALYR